MYIKNILLLILLENIRLSKSPKRNTTKWHGRGNTFPRSVTTVGDKHVGFVWGQWNSEIYIGRTDKEQANPELFMEDNGLFEGHFFSMNVNCSVWCILINFLPTGTISQDKTISFVH